jgi:predicted nucleic acid-binding Zn ribbon protein
MTKLSDLLPAALSQSGVLRAARAQIVMKNWTEAVGPVLADKTTPDRFESGTVWVSAKGSAWAQELRLHQETVLARLNEMSGERGLFKELRVGVRPPRIRQLD